MLHTWYNRDVFSPPPGGWGRYAKQRDRSFPPVSTYLYSSIVVYKCINTQFSGDKILSTEPMGVAVLSAGAVDAAKKRSAGKSKSKGTKGKRGHGGVREEIRQLQEELGVDDPNRTPQVNKCVTTAVSSCT